MKVFAAPEEIKLPETDYRNIENHVANEEAFVEQLGEWCKEHGGGKHSGKIVRYPHADGHAQYMVFEKGRAMSLIHLPLGDSWDLPEPYTRGLRRADVVEKLEAQERLSALFARSPTP